MERHAGLQRTLSRSGTVLLFFLVLFGGLLKTLASDTPQRSRLIVVSDDDYPPFIFRDASGKPQGILPDQWALWQKKTGIAVDLRAMEWSAAKSYILDGQADVIDTIFFSESRARTFAFTPPYATIHVPVYVRKTLGGIHDVHGLHGFTIGVKAGDAVIEHLGSLGIDSIKTYPNYEAIIVAAHNQQLNVFSVDEPAALYYLYKYDIADHFREAFHLYTGRFHRAVLKDQPELLSLVNSGFAQISKRELGAINRKWLGKPLSMRLVYKHLRHWIYGVAGLIAFLFLLSIILSRIVRIKTATLRRTLDSLEKSERAHKSAEEALRESHDIFTSLMRHTPIYAIIYDVLPTCSRVVMASENHADLLGIPGSQMIGKTVDEIFPAPIAARVTTTNREVIAHGDVVKREDEQSGRHYVTILFPIIQKTRSLLAGYTIDVTELKQAEAEKAALQRQLMQSQKLESVGRLAGGVSHDFNNMLQAILGYTEMALESCPADAAIRADLESIRKVALRSSTLTRQLQTIARRQVISPKPLNVNTAIEQLADLLRRLIDETIDLQCRFDPQAGSIYIDTGQFDQLIINLCLNARDAAGKDGRITITTAAVCVNEKKDPAAPNDLHVGQYVRISVSDNGKGIPADVREHMFDPFFTTKPIGKGTGLGLSIVYGIVKQNGGGIHVESAPDCGSSFDLYLPQYDGQPADAPVDETPIIMTDKSATLLVVDDDEFVLNTTQALLANSGYQVFAASSPERAREIFDEHAEHIQLVLSDVVMPGLNGPELVQCLLKRNPSLNYVFMSGHTANLLAIHGLDQQKQFCIRKPFTKQELLKTIQQALARHA